MTKAMTIRSVDDFLARPKWWEFVLLGLCQCICLVIISLVYSGFLSLIWCIASVVAMVATIYIFYSIQKKRSNLAACFYKEWLSALNEQELTAIKERFPSNLIEGEMVEATIQARKRAAHP